GWLRARAARPDLRRPALCRRGLGDEPRHLAKLEPGLGALRSSADNAAALKPVSLTLELIGVDGEIDPTALHIHAAILEVAVHKTLRTLDIVPHVLTSMRVTDPTQVQVAPP